MDPAAAIPADALVLLIGPAASGKSTWAATRFPPSQVLSSDAFREMVADDASDQAATRDAFRLLHLVARARVERGLLTVIDATNLQRAARTALLGLAARNGRPTIAVVLDVPLDELLARNAARARSVPAEVVRRHHAQLAAAVADLAEEGYQSILRP